MSPVDGAACSSVQKGGGESEICGRAYLYYDNFDPGRVPALPFPTLDTHGTQAQERDGAVTFSQFHAVANLR